MKATRFVVPLALLFAVVVPFATATSAQAAPTAPASTGGPSALGGHGLSLLLSVAVVSLVPFLFLSLTAFVKISTVLQITKSAIGAQSVPSNTVVLALSGALTLLAMAPTANTILERATPVLAEKSESPEVVTKLVEAAKEPMRSFLKANASDKELARFVDVAKASRSDKSGNAGAPAAEVPSATDFSVLAPAFVVTELTEAFAIGFLIFLPFLVIDLVVANLLASLGLQTLSVSQVSLPFKLLLFVAIDGWGLLAQALVLGYRH
jgi:type III secretion protein R